MGGSDLGPSAGPSSGSGDGFEECAKSSEAVGLARVHLFFTIDRSISMASGGKWDTLKAAFVAFVQESQADSLNVALRFWEDDDGCDAQSCDPVGCSVPQVDLGSLADPAHEQALIALYDTKAPGGGTPMSAALAGATLWAKTNQQAATGADRYVVVLVTDGKPAKCEKDIVDVAAYAQQAYDDAGVLTFALGVVDSNPEDMDLIATAGGTGQGYQVGAANAEADLLAALLAIGESAGGCTFALPESADGDTLDPKLVNVTRVEGSAETTILQVPNAEACSDAGGWYYDDPIAPSTITLCPTSCASIPSDGSTHVEIVLGCATEVQ